ncbi:MAG: hypothetical protein H5T85_03150, partial [Actinobacteria bacterium]|nr:hypothetical protein [Actinomycetota bacterium]
LLSPSLSWKKAYAKLYIEFLAYFKGEEKAVKEFRKILGWIFKKERGVSRLREKFFKVETYEDAINVIDNLEIS